ncbi:hypothetical protein L596_018438 [Steinernema carpocapsae]|uniref:Uncharacterized protein n=1 Tax=Steinernema carpocapsae TaxID=34508 RepID=A0A4U5N4L6_STECR|nr:hypothetical protein L596_018438 [Steinernema carpocapsae]
MSSVIQIFAFRTHPSSSHLLSEVPFVQALGGLSLDRDCEDCFLFPVDLLFEMTSVGCKGIGFGGGLRNVCCCGLFDSRKVWRLGRC